MDNNEIKNLVAVGRIIKLANAGAKTFEFPIGVGTRVLKVRVESYGNFATLSGSHFTVLMGLDYIDSYIPTAHKSVLTIDSQRIQYTADVDGNTLIKSAIKPVIRNFYDEPVFLEKENFYVYFRNSTGNEIYVLVIVIFDPTTRKR